MKRKGTPQLSVALVTGITLLATLPMFGQEWSAAQQEVWKNVQAYTALVDKGDVEAFGEYFHEDFSGWAVGSVLPSNKAERMKLVRHFLPKRKTVLSEIKPVAIKVHGNVAVVHYYYMDVSVGDDGEEEVTQGRWTDILMKQGDKWIMIADHGGPSSDDDDD